MNKKFVLIGQQGSGTNLLGSFLSSHPDIHMDGELFVSGQRNTGPFRESGHTDKKKYLSDFYKGHEEKGKKAVGFDLKYNQMEDDILDYLQTEKVGIVNLHRDSGRTFLRGIKKAGSRFCYGDIIKYCENVDKFRKRVRRKFFYTNPYVEIYYEDMTRGREIAELPLDFEKMVLEWLGVSYRKLRMTKKYNSRELIIKFK